MTSSIEKITKKKSFTKLGKEFHLGGLQWRWFTPKLKSNLKFRKKKTHNQRQKLYLLCTLSSRVKHTCITHAHIATGLTVK